MNTWIVAHHAINARKGQYSSEPAMFVVEPNETIFLALLYILFGFFMVATAVRSQEKLSRSEICEAAAVSQKPYFHWTSNGMEDRKRTI